MVCNTRGDIPQFLNEQGLTGYGAEIGVFRGEYSKVLLQNWKGQELYLIDAWRHFEGVVDISNHTIEGQGENLRATFNAVYPFLDRATIIRGLSSRVASLFPDEYFDFVFLDANHTYEGVTEDARSWYPKVKTNGYLMGHDYLDCTMCDTDIGIMPTVFGVKSAVDHFAFVNNLKVVVIPEEPYPSWYIRREPE